MTARIESLLPVAKRVARNVLPGPVLARLSPDVAVVMSPGAEPAREIPRDGLGADILVYFADSPLRAYQLDQWLPVFERLAERHRVVLLARNSGTFRLLRDRVRFPLLYVRRLRQLEVTLESVDPKLCLYVNNSMHNFQALAWRRALHVHLNHGESDKISMASNQAKAYDAVFVAGEAAEARYRNGLIAFEGSNLVRVGRPQLDLELPSPLPAAGRPTVLYAPTWEGDTPAMDYSSLVRYGPQLVRNLVDANRVRLVYKPHPRVETGSRAVVRAHREVMGILRSANAGLEPAERHVVEMEAQILGLFEACDVLVSDVSSVALDWLYLRTEAPLWLCDPYDDRARLERVSPAAAWTAVLDSSSLPAVARSIEASLADDPHRAAREVARRFYFGDLKPGESMTRFLDAVEELAGRRDTLLEGKRGSVGLDIAAGVA